MTTLTLRYIKGDFVVTGPDIQPTRFKTRREAKDWCEAHYPGSPIKEIGAIYKPPARSDQRCFIAESPWFSTIDNTRYMSPTCPCARR